MSAPRTVPAIAPTGVVDGVEDAEADEPSDELMEGVGEVVPVGPMVDEGEFLLMHEVSSVETTVYKSELPPCLEVASIMTKMSDVPLYTLVVQL